MPKGSWTKEQARLAGLKGAEVLRQRREAALAAAGLPPTPSRLEILDRRLKTPHLGGTGKIELSIPGNWTLRWANTAIEGRWENVTDYKGWEPVAMTELKNPRQVIGLTATPEGYAARGARASEILMRMPTEYFQKIQQRKVELRQTKATGRKLRQDIAEHVSAFHGRPDVAEAIDSARGELRESIERVELDADEGPTAG